MREGSCAIPSRSGASAGQAGPRRFDPGSLDGVGQLLAGSLDREPVRAKHQLLRRSVLDFGVLQAAEEEVLDPMDERAVPRALEAGEVHSLQAQVVRHHRVAIAGLFAYLSTGSERVWLPRLDVALGEADLATIAPVEHQHGPVLDHDAAGRPVGALGERKAGPDCLRGVDSTRAGCADHAQGARQASKLFARGQHQTACRVAIPERAQRLEAERPPGGALVGVPLVVRGLGASRPQHQLDERGQAASEGRVALELDPDAVDDRDGGNLVQGVEQVLDQRVEPSRARKVFEDLAGRPGVEAGRGSQPAGCGCRRAVPRCGKRKRGDRSRLEAERRGPPSAEASDVGVGQQADPLDGDDDRAGGAAGRCGTVDAGRGRSAAHRSPAAAGASPGFDNTGGVSEGLRRDEVSVRAAAPGDVPAMVALYEAVAAERLWLGAEAPLDREAQAETFLGKIAAPERAAVFVAVPGRTREPEQDPSILGLLQVEIRAGIAQLGMAIGPSHRGAGIGRCLLETCVDWARSRGSHKVTLQVWPHNVAARALYARLGFVEEGWLRRQWPRRDGSLWDAVVMGRVLDEVRPGSPPPRVAKPRPLGVPVGGLVAAIPGGGLVRLRPFRPSDAAAVAAAVQDVAIQEAFPELPHPFGEADALERFAAGAVGAAAGSGLELAVVDEGDRVLGALDLALSSGDPGLGELGWWLARDARGRGVMTIAVGVIADHARAALGVARLEALLEPGNERSARVAARVGFAWEARRRAYRPGRAGRRDLDCWVRVAGPAAPRLTPPA